MQSIELNKGILLVSEPFLPDPNFKRSVVLLTEHDDEGSIGFVLNRPTELTVNDVLEDFPIFNGPLHIGGPVEQNTLHFIHMAHLNIPESKEVLPGICWGGDFEMVREMIKHGQIREDELRFFIGYSGWSVEQIKEEIDGHAWILAKADSATVLMAESDQLWREVLIAMGNEYKLMANYPEDPRLN